ncbi:MAG: hypothetical protein U0103_24060 [Candidatus Obscuribacterales bacterium]
MSSTRNFVSKLKTKEALIASMFLTLALLFAWVDGGAWSHRTGWDLVSYLDLGDAFLKGDWTSALNSYWSPLYGIAFALVHKPFENVTSELELLKFFNFCIFIMLALAFGFLVHALRRSLAKVDTASSMLLPENTFSIVLYTTFIYCSLTLCGIRYKTPDVMSALFVLCFFCLWQRSITKPISVVRATFMGVLLGFCYFAKNSLVNWVALVILSLFMTRKLTQITGKQLIALTVATAVTVFSWAIPISINIGHFTLTDTLTVARSWMWTLSPGLKQVHGQGPTFKHPTREFFRNPDFYEFATPFDVSYSPWYAPAYWFEGVPWKFSFPYYLQHLLEKIPQLLISYLGVLLFGFGSLWLIVRRSPFSKDRLLVCLPMILPSVAGLGALAAFFEHEGRYFIPYTLPLFAALFICLKAPERESSKRAQILVVRLITTYMVVCSLLSFTMQFYFFSPEFANSLKSALKIELPPSPPFSPHEATIKALKDLGLVAGDRVARISTLGHGEFYWIRGGKFKVVAECVDPTQFAQASPERRQQLYEKLRQLGVKAIVEDWVPDQEKYPTCKDPGWINVAGTRNWLYRL